MANRNITLKESLVKSIAYDWLYILSNSESDALKDMARNNIDALGYMIKPSLAGCLVLVSKEEYGK